MRSVFTRALLIAVLSVSVGLHWAALQMVAWTGMVITYSRDGSISEAISKTFDGAHKCRLCKLVDEGREKNSAPGVRKSPLKLEGSLAAAPLKIFPPDTERIFLPPAAPAPGRAERPPSPPPRA
jgi:hypothetical protein